MMNPSDRNALEWALRLKEKGENELVALSLCEPERESVLREALALGADRAVILSDPSFLGGDATSVSAALAQALRKVGPDVILAGEGQVGHRVAESMKIPSFDAVTAVEPAEGGAAILSAIEQEPIRIQSAFPVLLSVRSGSNTPRIANAIKIMKAAKKEIARWNPAEIDLKASEIGPAGSGMRTFRIYPSE